MESWSNFVSVYLIFKPLKYCSIEILLQLFSYIATYIDMYKGTYCYRKSNRNIGENYNIYLSNSVQTSNGGTVNYS